MDCTYCYIPRHAWHQHLHNVKHKLFKMQQTRPHKNYVAKFNQLFSESQKISTSKILQKTTISFSVMLFTNKQTDRQTVHETLPPPHSVPPTLWAGVTNTHTQPFNGLWSGTTRVGRYQKKHSPTHTHPDHRASFINFLHLLRFIASSSPNHHLLFAS